MKEPRLAIISGGTGYVGGGITKELQERGWIVAVLSRTASENASDIYHCDITNEDEVAAVVDEIVHKHGEVHACIHAAATPLERIPLLSVSSKSFNTAMDTAVRGAFLLAKAARPHMKPGAGFIGITTQAIENPASNQKYGAYLLVKLALRSFLRTLSTEVTSEGIRVYAVAPGFLPGGLNRDLPQKVLEFLSSKKGGGLTSVEEVAKVVSDLCEGESGVPGGMSIGVPGEGRPL